MQNTMNYLQGREHIITTWLKKTKDRVQWRENLTQIYIDWTKKKKAVIKRIILALQMGVYTPI